MAVKLNEPAFEQAKNLIEERKVVLDERDAWSEHQPGAADENRFIERHGLQAYGHWHQHTQSPKDRLEIPGGAFAAGSGSGFQFDPRKPGWIFLSCADLDD